MAEFYEWPRSITITLHKNFRLTQQRAILPEVARVRSTTCMVIRPIVHILLEHIGLKDVQLEIDMHPKKIYNNTWPSTVYVLAIFPKSGS